MGVKFFKFYLYILFHFCVTKKLEQFGNSFLEQVCVAGGYVNSFLDMWSKSGWITNQLHIYSNLSGFGLSCAVTIKMFYRL